MRCTRDTFFKPALALVLGALLLLPLVLPLALAAESATPALEKPSAINNAGYTVLGRMFMGTDGNLSFLRLLNLSGSNANVSAILVGSPSGRSYGTATVTVANHAARQLSITDLMGAANVTALIGGDDRFAVYLRADASPIAVQNVLFSGATGFFENMSSCQNSSVSDSNAALMNVHTTTITGFTSYVTIYNYSSNEATYDVPVYEAGAGTLKGQVSVSVAANSTFEQPFSWFQDQVQWTPTATEYHANIQVLPRSGVRSAQVSHTVYNSKLGVYLNLTNFCTVESASGTLPVANADTLSGATMGLAYSIPSTTLLANDLNATGAALTDVTTPVTNGATNGSLIQTGNELVLVPARAGIVTFQYRLRVGDTTSGFATVTVNVSDGGPIADGDRLIATFSAGTTSTILLSTLTNNDHNTTGTRLVNVTSPMTDNAVNGTLTLTADGLVYTPARPGTVTFRYQLQNTAGTLSNAALVTLTVGGSNAPTAVNDTLTQSFVVGQASEIPIRTLTANDLNADNANFENISTPLTDGTANGNIQRSTDGLVYTPTRAGTAVFTYQLRNGSGLSNAATVTITILGATAAPIATADTLSQTFAVGSQSTILFSTLVANDLAATGANLETATAPTTDGTANGSFTRIGNDLVFTPARAGLVTFSYQIRTGNGVSNTAVVRLIVG
jgi:hypothetical protein